MQDQIVIGIDPGSKGAMCALNVTRKIPIFLGTDASPLVVVQWLEQLQKEGDLRIVMIENVTTVPGSSATSNFNFGYNVGYVTGIIKALGLPLDKVRPKAWQKYVGVPAKAKGKQIKTEVAKLAAELYPNASLYGARGGLLDGRSDALMIAHYAAKHHILGEK